jgi:hypothetical protein
MRTNTQEVVLSAYITSIVNKVVAVVHHTISAGGNSTSAEVHEIRTDSTIKYIAVKQ